MKRFIAVGSILIILIGAGWLLSRPVIDPQEYTGRWYGAEDGKAYLFREGIITEGAQEDEGFQGAYLFCKDRILLFTVSPDGNSKLRELYPAGGPKGEFLSEGADGTGSIVFARRNIAAQNPSQSK